MDALLQASADNGYLPGYFWLPWKSRGSVLKIGEPSSDVEPGHDPDRERQPGLIILKSVYKFDEVIYLFVVGETATEGVDGAQLQNSFIYESQLQTALGSHFSRGNSPKKIRVAIVGPTFSGSAASLRAGIDAAAESSDLRTAEFHIAGATYTSFPVKLLTRNEKSDPPPPPAISYISFGYDSDYATKTFLEQLDRSGYDLARVALLVEDNTAYASGLIASEKQRQSKNGENLPLTIRFPREISSLRNAPGAADQSGSDLPGAISPYLRFSVKDYSNTRDSIAVFSREITPLSQEAQLMTIARQLHRNRTQFVVLSASNVLDLIFLAQFLHRACPEATLVFSGDLLTVREIDSVPFVGSISINPYPLIGLGRSARPGRPVRTYTSSYSYSYYNAVSYTLWENGLHQPDDTLPVLEGYRNLLNRDAHQPPLWATAVGNDGYYPLGILRPCSSGDEAILPRIENKDPREMGKPRPQVCGANTDAIAQVTIYPSRLWDLACFVVIGLCLFHAIMLQVAGYWSPLSRDLAVGDNDLPQRRTLYIHVAIGMLFAMTFVVSFPVLWLWIKGGGNPLSTSLSIVALSSGFLAVLSTLSKTRQYLCWHGPSLWSSEQNIALRFACDGIHRNFYLFLNLILLMAIAAILCLWSYSCFTGSFVDHSPDFAGLSFCFRSINPGTGISPLEPVLLLILGWYTWALMQTKRLRFSESARPRLPKRLDDPVASRLFLSDDELAHCRTPIDSCLYNNITCLFITRQIFKRFFWFRRPTRTELPAQAEAAVPTQEPDSRDTIGVDITLTLVSGSGLALLTLFAHVRSIDHFVWNTGPSLPSPYEFLFIALLSTLIAVCLAGWLRMIVIWRALRRGVLERLENLPIRFAFSRIKGMAWITMLRHGGLEQQWRDISRSIESMSNLSHQPDFPSAERQQLYTQYGALMSHIAQFRERIANPAARPAKPDYESVKGVEETIAAFSQFLLSSILIPHWQNERNGPVEGRETEHAGAPDTPLPEGILAAEEFLVIRYISLITAVLANLRYLMTFVSVSFVLAFLACNLSSFQPRRLLDWSFTVLLAILGLGVIAVFAQMHRNTILSRITDTNANQLGWDFYFRIVSFGALPVLTWLAYQFPDFGTKIYRFIEPAVPVIK